MFSFWGDTVLDPFCGTGTTMLAAMKCGRNSLGVEIDEEYCRMTLDRLKKEEQGLPTEVKIEFSRVTGNGGSLAVNEEPAVYKAVKSSKAAKRKT